MIIIDEGFVHRWKLIYCKWNTRPLLHANFTFLHHTLINPATALEIITKSVLVWGYNTVQYNGWSPRINPHDILTILPTTSIRNVQCIRQEKRICI